MLVPALGPPMGPSLEIGSCRCQHVKHEMSCTGVTEWCSFFGQWHINMDTEERETSAFRGRWDRWVLYKAKEHARCDKPQKLGETPQDVLFSALLRPICMPDLEFGLWVPEPGGKSLWFQASQFMALSCGCWQTPYTLDGITESSSWPCSKWIIRPWNDLSLPQDMATTSLHRYQRHPP